MNAHEPFGFCEETSSLLLQATCNSKDTDQLAHLHSRAKYQFTVYIGNRIIRLDICTVSNVCVSNKNIDHHFKKVCTVSYSPKFVISFQNLFHYVFNLVCKMTEQCF